VLDERGEGLADFVTAGVDAAARRRIGELPRGRGVLSLLIDTPRPLRLAKLSRHPRSYGFPRGHPPMETFLGVPIVVRGQAWGNLYLTEKRMGSEFDADDEESAVVLAGWAAIAVENAQMYRRSAERRLELERSVKALAATTEIARAVGGEMRLDRVLELIAKRSRALVEASGVVILLAGEDELTVAAVAGELPREIVGASVSATDSTAARVLATGRPERVAQVNRLMRFALDDLGVHPVCGLFVPLEFRGEKVGVIEAFDRIGGPQFHPEDERMLLAAAASAATAVATAQSVEREWLERTVKAAEEERQRWARELHDETLQGLAGLRVLLAASREGDDPGRLEAAVDLVTGGLAEEIGRLRALITDLRPAALDELGLAAALEALFDRMSAQADFELEANVASLSGARSERLDPDLETAVYRVLQEALRNAARHSRADRVVVEVALRDGELRLRVSDNGCGFDPGVRSDGFGLTSMRDRIALAHGRFEIRSGAHGTTVLASLPLAQPLRWSA
jgi:signal transduction histidine kinase